MSSPEPRTSADRVREAEDLYAEFLARKDVGKPVDFEAFCAEHSRLRTELVWIHGCYEQDPDPTGGGSTLIQRIQQHFGGIIDPAVSLEPKDEASPSASHGSVEAAVGRFARRAPGAERYEIQKELGRGGMGAVFQVWDRDLRRRLAMKVILSSSGEESATAARLMRFLEEAQVTGQLDHPGIAPVHELGFTDDEHIYFTMKMVKGQDLREVFELARTREQGWGPTRVLGALIKVCEAMAYAHSRGVIHRDLKPANIMVGRFGAVYVMDWGLARVLRGAETKDIRIRPEEPDPNETDDASTVVRVERTAAQLADALKTMDGDVVGTPAYMCPEQARGRVDDTGPAWDIYSIGAMLYHLLAGHAPYVEGGYATSHAILTKLLLGPPRPIHAANPGAPPELVAICEKAMARRPEDRYTDMQALVDDLEAWRDGRVVKAFERGAWAAFRKWVRRNRALAASIAVGGLVAVIGASSTMYVQARLNRRLSHEAYEANIAASAFALENGNPGEAERRLLRCAENRRDWEWDYLWLRKDASLDVMLGHRDRVESVAYAPDGRWLVTASYDKRVCIWDAASGELAHELDGHAGFVHSIVFAPGQAGRFVSGDEEGSVRLWDVATGHSLATFQVDQPVRSLQFDAAGERLLVGGGVDGSIGWIELWDVARQTRLFGIRAHDSDVLSVAFRPDGGEIASACRDGTVRFWSPEGESRGQLAPHSKGVGALAYRPDGEQLATGSFDRVVRLWRVSDRAPLGELTGHDAEIVSLAYDSAGTQLASAAYDDSVRLWDGESGALLAVRVWPAIQVESVTFRPDGARIATASADRCARTWPAAGFDGETLAGHSGRVAELVYSSDGKRLASASWDGTARVWDSSSGDGLLVLRGHEGAVSSAAFQPQPGGTEAVRVATAGADGDVCSWALDDGRLASRWRAHDEPIHDLAFSSDGAWLATASEDGEVRLWDPARPTQPVQTLFMTDAAEVGSLAALSVAFSPDGRLVAAGGESRDGDWGHARVWETSSGELLAESRPFHADVNSIEFRPDGRELAVGLFYEVQMLAPRTLKNVARVQGHDNFVRSIAYTPDGSRVLSVSGDDQLWCLDPRRESTVAMFARDDERLYSVAMRPDGREIATGSNDGTILLWPRDREVLRELHEGATRRRASETVVDELFDELWLARLVVEALGEPDRLLDPELRESAVRLALFRGQAPARELWPRVRARLLAESGRGSWHRGERGLDALEELGLEADSLALGRALADLRLGRPEQAVETLAGLSPAEADERAVQAAALARAHLKVGDEELARQQLQDSSELMDERSLSPDVADFVAATRAEVFGE